MAFHARYLTTSLLLCLVPGGLTAQESEAALMARARAIHERVITLDTHVDINPANFTAERHYGTGLSTQVDLPKMEQGGLDAAFLIVYVGQSADLTATGFERAHAAAMEKFQAIHRLTDSLAPDRIGLARTADEVRRIAASGRKVALIGVENGYSLGADLDNVRRFAELGARYLSLAHNGHSHLSDSNTGERDGIWTHGGLSPLGREVVAELNRWGVMIDISHPSKASMMETIGLSRAPIIASHSAIRALCNHSRNLDDEQLQALKRNGGVVQVVAFNGYVKCSPASPEREAALAALRTEMGMTGGSPSEVRALTDEQRMRYRDRVAAVSQQYPPPPRATVKDFVDHIDYAVRLIGLDHVGISSDFDGGGGVDGWNSAAETFHVTLELVRRGYTEAQIEQLWSGNLLRVMDEVDRIGRELRAAKAQDADLVLTGARVWTGDSTRPWAEAVAVTGDRITAVGTAAEMAPLTGAGTRVIELKGRFISPGFIDNHTHFGQAGGLLLGVNLLDVADPAGLILRVREARDRMPAGAWLVGGDWGAYEAWAQGSTGRDTARVRTPFSPSRDLIDSITPDTPALLSKWDRSAWLANGKALELSGADCAWDGVECRNGRATGRLSEVAAARVRRAIPPKAMPQRLAEARMALDQLKGFGVTTVHDITGFDQLAVYQELKRRGELTVRIFARPTLDNVDRLLEMGILPGFGDEWVKIGGLKGFVDGIMGNSSARFHEPYLTSGKLGEWRVMMNPPGNMARLLKTADSAGYWPMVHAIGDHGIDTLLTMFEEVMRVNGPGMGPKPRRFRVIHTQVMRGPEVADRMARLGLIAEVQPYHAIDDMRWMEQRIGERSRWAYAFRTLRDAGVLLSFGSDWPGTNAAWYTADPIVGMYAAVTRQTLEGAPAEGWFPEERVDLETALRAYTVNNAWAAGEEGLKGRVAPGLLADLVVWDRDPFGVSGTELKDRRIALTVLGGRIVHDAR